MPVIDLDFVELRRQIVGIDMPIQTPFGERLMVYADFTASGRSLTFIEDYLLSLQSLYANSHTEDDFSGRATTELLRQAERLIKRAVNAGPDGRIIACGSGATGAIDRMQQLVGVKLPSATRSLLDHLLGGFLGRDRLEALHGYFRDHQPVVFVGPYEHHSNEISWRESLCTVVEVKMEASGGIDLAHLEALLEAPAYRNRLRIGSFSAASNVTGMRSPVHEIAGLLHRHEALAFFDFAASAPYVDIDMNPMWGTAEEALDAVFISPHKFLGGPGASGLLIFNKRCYHQELPPSIAGGGTVEYVGPEDHDFIGDIEAREKAGTPGILQTIKAALAFEVKLAIGTERIGAREHQMTQLAMARWGEHPGIEILGNPDPERRIGIISFNVRDPHRNYLHPRFVTTLLNDLFGIQTRAGCSCAGPYGHKLLDIDPHKAAAYRTWISRGYHGVKPGWCRIGFHYAFDDLEVDYLLDAVEFVADHGHRFLHQYRFDAREGGWEHKHWQETKAELSLLAALGAQARRSPPDYTERRDRYRQALDQARELARAGVGGPEGTEPLPR
ncbi:MAG: aminotransferase class V-fold PLP-dependent enzyme [Gammaproteobacteria bacterium]|nr:aminotransferase class V-fold PLP-dependent enzyme [Gammaproteobacteria bacterium]